MGKKKVNLFERIKSKREYGSNYTSYIRDLFNEYRDCMKTCLSAGTPDDIKKRCSTRASHIRRRIENENLSPPTVGSCMERGKNLSALLEQRLQEKCM